MTDMTQRIDPLSAEEEMVLRSPATRIYHTMVVAQLLATLDRDRSAANERIAVLVKALKLIDYLIGPGTPHSDILRGLRETARSALGATETEPGEGTWEAYKDAFPAGKNVRE